MWWALSKDYFNPPWPTTNNFNLNQPCVHYKVYNHDIEHYFTLHPELQQVQPEVNNVGKP